MHSPSKLPWVGLSWEILAVVVCFADMGQGHLVLARRDHQPRCTRNLCD